MHVGPQDPPDRLAELIRAGPRARVARRLAAVRLALLGHTAAAAAGQVLLSDGQVRTWVARFNAGGVGALAGRSGRGRKGPPPADQPERLRDRLRAGPTEADGGVCALRGGDVRRSLEREFGVARRPQAVYDLLHRRGFEPPAPAPPAGRPGRAGPLQKSLPGRVAAAAAAHPGGRVEVWF